MIDPFLRYVGGKRKSIGQILEVFPKYIGEYREPMIGSGAILLGLLQTRVRPEKITIGDINYDVYNIWNTVVKNPKELTDKAIEIKNRILNEEMSLAELNTMGKDGVEAAALYLIDNYCRKLGNYGNYIDNYRGKLKNFENNYRYKLLGTSDLLGNNIEVNNYDYEIALKREGKNVCVFLDPPYYNVNPKGGYYGLYSANFDFERLYDNLVNTKHNFVMTIDKSMFSDKLKEKFKVKSYGIYYWMNAEWREELLVYNF